MVLPSGGVHLPHVGNDAPRQAGLPDLLGVGVQHVGNLHVRTARGLQLPQQTLRDGLQRRPFSLVCGGGECHRGGVREGCKTNDPKKWTTRLRAPGVEDETQPSHR